MNNGKVRIYELSRELNLDNRDILAICSQQNIPVKSHSSTITETEAEQIRTAAEKYTPSPSSSNRPSSPTPASGSFPKPASVSPPVKKQQILSVQHRQQPMVAEPPKRPEAPARPAASAPPSFLGEASARSDSGSRLSMPPSRPTLRQAERQAELDRADQPEPEDVLINLPDGLPDEDSIAVEADLPEIIAPATPPSEATAFKPEVQAASSLVKPPSRPVPKTEQPSSRFAERPTPKSDKPLPTKARSLEIVQVRSESAGSGAAAPSKPSAAPRPKPVLELRRPQPRPSTESEEATPTEGDAENFTIEIADSDTSLELRRPAPPRQPKRGKTRREEEEEDPDTLQRAKVATKTKRRPQVVDEDDEDFDDDSENGDEDSLTQVSLSLARPPKPKGRTAAQTKPTAAAPRAKRSNARESRNLRRERREQSVSRERPEILFLRDSISVHDLAEEMVVPETDIIKTLFFKGIATNINQVLDIPTAALVAEEFGVQIENAEEEAEARKVTEMLDANDLENLVRRPPVVTIMGHVDHGKTTLLDSIRKTKVAQGEAGGITQHIGAYHVDVEHNGEMQQVVFLDTPGHEAFTAMRARGARVTDIAVLVVAADDGVRPQTVEAISHAKAAEVPIVVAINKVDKEGAQPERVKQEMTEFGLVPEEWGGETIMVPVSAINGDNLDTLLEMLLLVSEVEDLYANPNRLARGTVIEANLDKSRGPVATLLIQNGTLRVGDTLVAGSAFCKVRAMIDDRGNRVDEAGPSFAVEVLGLSDVPAAGDEFEVYAEEKEARALAGDRADQQRQSRLQQAMASRRVTLNTLSVQAQEGDLKELNLILKSDVQGSLEAILGALQQLPQKEVQVRVLFAAPGEISETDVDLAAASNAVIIGFNTTLASGARQAADEAGVDVRDYTIIYKLLEDIQGAMEGLLEPEMVEDPLGQLEVRAVFPVGKGAVAGCYVQSGKAIRNCRIRVHRGNQVVFEGNLDSLKRMKDDVKEVNAGYECGIGLDSFNSWKEGDIIETFKLISKRRSLTV